MKDDFYKEALNSAIEELSLLTRERDELNLRIEFLDERLDKLRQVVLGLSHIADFDIQKIKDENPNLFPEYIDPRLGVTEAVRKVLQDAGTFMTPTDIRDGVLRVSNAIHGHKNPMATIHTVLRRLIESDEVGMFVDQDEKTTYAWIGDEKARKNIANQINHKDASDMMSRMKKKAPPVIDGFSGQGSPPNRPVIRLKEKPKIKKK
jgi:hypothetical protein